MIAGMAPLKQESAFVFCTTQDKALAHRLADAALAIIRETEGITLILPVESAKEAGFDTAMPMAQITLQVHSALDGVGLTAAVATALAAEGIACNMVAGYHHDHAFVPLAQADAALACLVARASAG